MEQKAVVYGPDGVGPVPLGQLDVQQLRQGGAEDRQGGDQRLHHRPRVHLSEEDRILSASGFVF